MSLQIKFILVLYLRKPGFIFSPFHAEIKPPSRRKRWAAPWDWDGGGRGGSLGWVAGQGHSPSQEQGSQGQPGQTQP